MKKLTLIAFILIITGIMFLSGCQNLFSIAGNPIAGAYEYETDFMDSGARDICADTVEYEIVEETVLVQDGYKVVPSYENVRRFCNIGSGEGYWNNAALVLDKDIFVYEDEIDEIYQSEGLSDTVVASVIGGVPPIPESLERGGWVKRSTFQIDGIEGRYSYVTKIRGTHIVCENGIGEAVFCDASDNVCQTVSIICEDRTQFYVVPAHDSKNYANDILLYTYNFQKPVILKQNHAYSYKGNKIYNTQILGKKDVIIPQDEKITIKYAVPKSTIPSELHFRYESCPLPSGYYLRIQSFETGDIISKEFFAYEPLFFCKRNPVKVIDTATSSIENNDQLYLNYVDKGTIIVPEGKRYLLSYVTTQEQSEFMKEKMIEIESLESEIVELNKKIVEREKIQKDLAGKLSDMDIQISVLNEQLNEQEDTVDKLQSQIDLKEQDINELKNLLAMAEQQIDEITKILLEKQKKIDELTQERIKQEQKIAELIQNLEIKLQKIEEISVISEEQKAEIERMRIIFSEQGSKIDELNTVVDSDKVLISDLRSSNDNQINIADSLQKDNDELKIKTTELENTLKMESATAESLKQKIKKSQETVQLLQKQNQDQQESMKKIEEISYEQQMLIDELEKKNNELMEQLQKKGWFQRFLEWLKKTLGNILT